MLVFEMLRSYRSIVVAMSCVGASLTFTGHARATECVTDGFPPCREDISGFKETFSVIPTPGPVTFIEPSTTKRDEEKTMLSADEAAVIVEPRRTLENKIFARVYANWLTVRHPKVSLQRIGAMVRNRYQRMIFSEVPAPKINWIGVEPMTLVYPVGYAGNRNPVTVNVRRIQINTSDEYADNRTTVAYYANYDRVDPENPQVIFQINGHFGKNPSRTILGIEDRGGHTGGALGRLAVKGYPIITYDDHNVGESSPSPGRINGLYRTLANLRTIDETLLVHFDRVDALGISGGAERLYHFLQFGRSPVKSAYIAGMFQAPWTALDSYEFTRSPFELEKDTFNVKFSQNFRWSEMALAGIANGVDVAFVSNTNESGMGKYFLRNGMIPTILQYTSDFQVRGDDRNFDGKTDFYDERAHEYDLKDYLTFLKESRGDAL